MVCSFEDTNLAAAQTIALHLLNQLHAHREFAPLATLITDLLATLQAAESLWTEGMKLDAGMLANLSLLQRDNLLSACRAASPEECNRSRAQSFASSCVFGLNSLGFRRPPRPAISPDASLVTGDRVVPLQTADRVLLASEMRTLTIRRPESPPQ